MQTNFTLAQLADPLTARSEHILRKCVHCGFCTATCPTFVLLGDERDSPRGRIYYIKAMLEGDRAPSAAEVRHVDRCLSCLSCMTTCPSGVNYMHLVDHGRHHIETRYARPLADRLIRGLLAWLMPRPARLRWALVLGRLAKPFAALLPTTSSDAGGATLLRRLRAMLDSVPDRLDGPSPVDRPQTFPAAGLRRRRVALMPGCGQQVLAPEVNEATVRLLTRHDIEVVNVAGSGCCGSSVQHVGRTEQAIELAKCNIDAWMREIDGAGLDAIVVNASGCGTTLKDYGHMLADEPAWKEKAEQVARLAKDVSEVMLEMGLANVTVRPLRVAYHSACSMQHGQKVSEQPKKLLRDAGFLVEDVPEAHLCCGWAGTYQVLQPVLSRRLRERKVAHIESLRPDIVAAGNFGCIGNIAAGTGLPVVHTVELLDWATGRAATQGTPVTVIRACVAALLGVMLGLGTLGLGALAQNGGSNTVLDTLFAKLQTATDPTAIQTLESAIWEQWIMVPDATQRGLMLRGIGEMQQRELTASVETFTRLIAIAPDMSEAWNKRATAYWLLGNFQASLADICETIKREPRHFGAYSGLGMIRAEMGEYPRAVAAFELARKYNPHITGIDDEIDRLKAMGGDGPSDPLGCSQRTAGR